MAKREWQAIRPDDQGRVDDVAISCDLFRLERMDTGVWWGCVYRGSQAVHFWLRRYGRDIEVSISEDGIGCVDDMPEPPVPWRIGQEHQGRRG